MAFRRGHSMGLRGPRAPGVWRQSGWNLSPPRSVRPSYEPPEKRIKGTEDQLNDRCTTDNNQEWPNTLSSHPEFQWILKQQASKQPSDDDDTEPVDLAPDVSQLEKLLQCVDKNPVSGLIEYTQFMSQECEFVLVQESGPSHDPRFTMQVVINGRQFPAIEASSKKSARKEAACAALRTLIRQEQDGEVTKEAPVNVTQEAESELLSSSSSSLPPAKNPISALMEIAQKRGHSCKVQLVSHDGPLHDHQFSFCVTFGDRIFPAVSANNTKMAKQMAAEAALKQLEKESGGNLFPEKVPKAKASTKDVFASDKPTPNKPKAARSNGVEDLMRYLRTDPMKGVLEYSRTKGCGAEFRLVDMSGPPEHPKYVFQTKVGSRWFPSASAHNRNKAKQDSAETALRMLIREAERAEHARGHTR